MHNGLTSASPTLLKAKLDFGSSEYVLSQGFIPVHRAGTLAALSKTDSWSKMTFFFADKEIKRGGIIEKNPTIKPPIFCKDRQGSLLRDSGGDKRDPEYKIRANI